VRGADPRSAQAAAAAVACFAGDVVRAKGLRDTAENVE